MKKQKAVVEDEFEPHPMDIALGLRVRTLRKSIGMSQDTLGRACGISFQQMQKYEHGHNRISFSRMVEISDVMGISVMTLIEPLVSKKGGTVDQVTDHLALLKTTQAVDLLSMFAKIKRTTQRSAVLRMVRAMIDEEEA